MVTIAMQGDNVSSLLRVSFNVFVLPPVRTIGNRWTHPASTTSSCLISIVIVVIITNYPASRCVEVMVCPTTTTAFFIEPLVLKRSIYLPSMMVSAGALREKKWTHKLKKICGFEFQNTLKPYFQKLAILWRLRKSLVIRLEPWKFWTFFNTKEKNSHSKIWMKMMIRYLPPWVFQFH